MVQDTIKRYLALKYRERNLASRVFSAWALFSRIQARKRKFEALHAKRETTKKKVDEFLTSLGTISQTSNEWIMQKVKQEKNKNTKTTYSLSLKRLKVKKPEVKEGSDKTTQQFPKIDDNKPGGAQTRPRSKEDTTSSLQKEIINAQREKMREQWKLIESLKEQKSRLQNNRPTTNSKIVRRIEKKIFIENEINECLDLTDDQVTAAGETRHKAKFQEEVEEKSFTTTNDTSSDCNYSDDFEDCSSETQSSIVPKTPEMLRKVREREQKRAARRDEIRKMHQERVEQERERLKALKEKEIQDEIDDRKKTREIWKKKRKDEMEKDKRRLVEKERQEKLLAIAAEFHRKLTMKQFGLTPWVKLIRDTRRKRLEADKLYYNNLHRLVYLLSICDILLRYKISLFIIHVIFQQSFPLLVGAHQGEKLCEGGGGATALQETSPAVMLEILVQGW